MQQLRNMSWFVMCIAFVCMVAIVHFSIADDDITPLPSAPGGASTIDDVLDAWSTRMLQTTSLDVEFSGSRTVSAEVIARDRDGGLSFRHGMIEGIPESTSYPVRFRFAVNDAGFLRMEGHIKIWDSENAGLIDKDSLHVFGPGGRKGLYNKSQFDFPVGHITTRSRTSIGRRAIIVPIRLVYFVLDKDIGLYAGSEMSLMPDSESISGYRCVAVRADSISKGGGTVSDILWVAPELAHVPLKLSRSAGGTLSRSIEFKYEKSLEGHPRLAAWVDTTYDSKGRVVDRIDVQCDSLVVNQPLSDSLFDVEFPEGTVVTDIVSETSYKTGADGAVHDERPLKPTGGNKLVPQPDTNSRGFFVVINVAVFCGAALWLFMRRRV